MHGIHAERGMAAGLGRNVLGTCPHRDPSAATASESALSLKQPWFRQFTSQANLPRPAISALTLVTLALVQVSSNLPQRFNNCACHSMLVFGCDVTELHLITATKNMFTNGFYYTSVGALGADTKPKNVSACGAAGPGP